MVVLILAADDGNNNAKWAMTVAPGNKKTDWITDSLTAGLINYDKRCFFSFFFFFHHTAEFTLNTV